MLIVNYCRANVYLFSFWGGGDTCFFPLFRKVCDHPYLLLDVKPTAGESEEQALEKMIAASGKLTLLDRMLPRLQVCQGFPWFLEAFTPF